MASTYASYFARATTLTILFVLFYSPASSIPNIEFRYDNKSKRSIAPTDDIFSLPLEESIDIVISQNFMTVTDYYNQPVKVCKDGYKGFPPNCTRRQDRSSCQYSTSCLDSEACIRGICGNPCEGIICGDSADCVVQGHNPKCLCQKGFSGNPFDKCFPKTEDAVRKQPVCRTEGESCGVDKTCQLKGGLLQCLCSPSDSNMTPDCRMRPLIPNSYCFVPDDCPNHQMCVKEKCRNPCDNVTCGMNAECFVKDHEPVCLCKNGFKGDPYLWCETTKLENNCSPNPCNEAVSKCEMPNVDDDWPVCTCEKPELCTALAKFKECRDDSECPNLSACIDWHCRDPCIINSCDSDEFCVVHEQKPYCSDYRLLNLRRWKH
ncbi:hypothetical protein QAD02_006030 [Eretmocerus hayati]|uniref:Uncharacterized protein n=1 Tax=Eretmocerus hayati TaxID=131215 RepID=A0ACC2N0V5_9HYME|nr:hypothetical protein QAD02_006030 [Eretmocerus hayati]